MMKCVVIGELPIIIVNLLAATFFLLVIVATAFCQAWTTTTWLHQRNFPRSEMLSTQQQQQQTFFFHLGASKSTTEHQLPSSSQNLSSMSTSSNEDEIIETIHGPWKNDSENFGCITQCWGRRPLIMRNAFDIESIPLCWDDVIQLACCYGDDENNNIDEEEDDDDFPSSRLIDHIPGTLDTYRVEFGPFPYAAKQLESRLLNPPKNPSTSTTSVEEEEEERASTLVVNDVDRYIRELSDWMDDQFNDFLPRWRRDDAQVSLAPIDGGIGPHVDNYDVFLIQASGSRCWQIGLNEISVKDEFDNLVSESQVRILNLTTTDSSNDAVDDNDDDDNNNNYSAIPIVQIELYPGDCLYLPPRIMHYGSSTSNDCVTLSVGCRAPSAQDLISRITEDIALSTAPSAVRRYVDDINTDMSSFDDKIIPKKSKELSSKVKNKMKELVQQAITDYLDNDDVWDTLVGKLITEPNRPTFNTYPIPLSEIDDDWYNTNANELGGCWGDANWTIDAVAEGKGILRRTEGITYAWSKGRRRTNNNHNLPHGGGSSPYYYRLYAHGRVFEVIIDDDSSSYSSDDHLALSSLLCRLANGPPILDKLTLKKFGILESSNIRKLICELIEEGFLYVAGHDEEEED